MIGKAYANRRKKEHRPEGDDYCTPMSLVWELLAHIQFNKILEPCAGQLAIVKALEKKNIPCAYSCISTGQNFFDYTDWSGDILTNPPFSHWDDFVIHAKKIVSPTSKICMLGRTNYFGTHKRNISGLWDHLKYVYVFDRMVDFQTPYRDDGLFHIGNMVTAWFIWDMQYTGKWSGEILNVQKYAKLGGFRNQMDMILINEQTRLCVKTQTINKDGESVIKLIFGKFEKEVFSEYKRPKPKLYKTLTGARKKIEQWLKIPYRDAITLHR